MYKIHCLNNISQVGLDVLSSDYEICENIEDADAILVRSADMHDMEFSDKLKCVARAGAGVNNIPLDVLKDKGIPVFNTPGANANAVKELVIAGLLLSSRDIIGGNSWVKENAADENIGKSAEKAKKAFAGGEIAGKTLGIIGLGAIGRLVCKACEALSMKVIGYDPFLDAEAAENISDTLDFTTDLNVIYRNCDYITIHVPANADTKGMIDLKAIDAMKDGVKFLNFSRDTLVNDDDMAKALVSGKVAKYVTDFANPAVVKMKNAIVLPHLGASTAEAEDNCAKMACESVMAYLERGEKIHCVNA